MTKIDDEMVPSIIGKAGRISRSYEKRQAMIDLDLKTRILEGKPGGCGRLFSAVLKLCCAVLCCAVLCCASCAVVCCQLCCAVLVLCCASCIIASIVTIGLTASLSSSHHCTFTSSPLQPLHHCITTSPHHHIITSLKRRTKTQCYHDNSFLSRLQRTG
jgi:hypothetical protein